MKTYILVGLVAVAHFENEDWKELEEIILDCKGGDIVLWDNETDSVSTLLDMLCGWNNFIELSQEDLNEIKKNTNIIIV